MSVEITVERINQVLNQVYDYGTEEDFANVLAAVLYLTATDEEAADFAKDEIPNERFEEIVFDGTARLKALGVTIQI
jgi:hypothetical protein